MSTTTKPERGFFRCTYEPGPVFISEKARKLLMEAVDRHIEHVEKNGPSEGCRCALCNEGRKTEFEELYDE